MWRLWHSTVFFSLLWPSAWWKQLRGRFPVAHSVPSPIHASWWRRPTEPLSTHHSEQEADSEAYRKGSRKNNSPQGHARTDLHHPAKPSLCTSYHTSCHQFIKRFTHWLCRFPWETRPPVRDAVGYFMFKTLNILKFQCGWREWFPEPTFRGEMNDCT